MLQHSHIFYITFIICLKELFDTRNFYKISLIFTSSALTYYFIVNDSIWVGLILWELVSIISAILIYDFKPENLENAIQVLFISLLSGACLLFSISTLPFDAGYQNLYTTPAQIGLCLAIAIKSGFFPFIWPQIASVADYNVSASLHSVTAIQLGIYLALKTNIWLYPLAQKILTIFCSATVVFGFFYLIWQKKIKSQVACITQVTNAAIVYSIFVEPNPEVLYTYVAFHALYKSVFFMWLGRKSWWICVMLVFLSLGFTYSSKSVISLLSKSFIIFVFINIILQMRGKIGLFKIGLIDFLFPITLFPLSAGLGMSFTKPSILMFILPPIMFALSRLNFRREFDLEPLGHFIYKSLGKLAYVLICVAGCVVVYFNTDLNNLNRLITSPLQLITLIPFLLGLYILFRAKQKMDFVIGLNLVSTTIAVLLFENGGIEICATHIVADLIVTIVLLRSDNELYAPQKRHFLYVIPIIFIIIIVTHKQTNFDLIFPVATHLNTLNEIVVNWRLLDTLGEMLVFGLSRYS